MNFFEFFTMFFVITRYNAFIYGFFPRTDRIPLIICLMLLKILKGKKATRFIMSLLYIMMKAATSLKTRLLILPMALPVINVTLWQRLNLA